MINSFIMQIHNVNYEKINFLFSHDKHFYFYGITVMNK
jgi:hypothetical protein